MPKLSRRSLSHIRRERKICNFIKKKKIMKKEIIEFLGITHSAINLYSGHVYIKHVCDVEEYLVQKYGYQP